jgi:ABC-type sugar transport system ATPase subunit
MAAEVAMTSAQPIENDELRLTIKGSLSATGISKRFGGVNALSNVDLVIQRGEVHGLVGENGAGKSTLIKILSGGLEPDSGSVHLDDALRSYSSPAKARKDGIVTIFQELAIVPDLTVAENIVLGAEPGFDAFGLTLSRRRANQIAASVLRRLGGDAINPRRRAGSLSIAERQLVEIGRAIALDAQFFIMDEPTASLSPREANALLDVIRQLRSEGKAILFVSHHLNEVLQICDRVTVLRGGQGVTTLPAHSATSERLIELMIGRPMETLYPPRIPSSGPPILHVRNLSRPPAFENISFELHRGEILGFAGLVGAGRTEIMRAIFGLDRPNGGAIEIDGKTVSFRSPRQAIRAGLAFVSEDRKGDGLVAQLSGRENLVMTASPGGGSIAFVRRTLIRALSERMRRELQIHGSLDMPVAGLSGGNQQKVVIGKWLLGNPRIIIFDEPTRGIDIGAKAEVYRTIQKASQDGAAILLVSSELSELMHVAHRILVISGGRMTAEMTADNFDEKEILKAAFVAHLSNAVATETEMLA